MVKQVKSKQRVADHGEVFTAEREVKAMCDLVKDECIRIDSRFLEPACGDGNFLHEILIRKLEVVIKRYKKSPYDYERNALLALGSIYGVELMMDNVLACRERLYKVWDSYYKKAVKKKERNDDVGESARYILEKNIICGNALSFHQVDDNQMDTGEPIIFSQWSFATGPLMKREDYIFEDLLVRKQASSEKSENAQLQLDISNNKDNEEGTLIKIYQPVNYRRLKEYE